MIPEFITHLRQMRRLFGLDEQRITYDAFVAGRMNAKSRHKKARSPKRRRK